jgi:hypothetical protein
MAGKKAFDEYLDKLAAYVKEFGLTNIPSDPDDIIKAKKSKLSTPAKTSSNKKKDRAP